MAVVLEWENAGFPPEKAAREAAQASAYLAALAKLRENQDWPDEAASLLLPDEKKFAKASMKAAGECRGANLFVLIGIGGSNLGAMAAYEFLLGKSASLLNESKILFLDTCDPSTIDETIRAVKAEHAKRHTVVFNVVSKSGTTLETLANFEAIFDALNASEKKNVKVYVTTDAGSKLQEVASKKGYKVLPIPPAVGGRYSVFSCAALFPLAWAGVDIERMLAGAKAMLSACLSTDLKKNPALAQATLMHLHASSGKNILDSFCFSNDLHAYGMWWKQLLAESSGKGGKGITPTVSIGSTDLHSQAQLFIGGPKDKALRLIKINAATANQVVPSHAMLSPLSDYLQNKSTSQIYSALYGGTRAAFKSNSLPFWEISLSAKTPEDFGALLQLDMMSVILFCKMLGVNAFDQPSVEAYKSAAKKLLQ